MPKIAKDTPPLIPKAATMESDGVKAIKSKPAMGPAPRHHKTTPQQLAAALRGFK